MTAEISKTDDSVLPQKMSDIGPEADRFLENLFPVFSVNEEQLSEYINEKPGDVLGTFRFISIRSIAAEDKEDLEKHLSETMSRFFIAMHPLGAPILWGVISENGKTRLVAGIQKKEHESVLRSVLDGMLTGSEMEDCSPDFSSMNNPYGGVISSIPVQKVDGERQFFDISSLMRCMSGKDYAVFFAAQPYSAKQAGEIYTEILDVRDRCSEVSRRNISDQKSSSSTVSDSKTTSTSYSESKSKSGGFSLLLISSSSSKTKTETEGESFSRGTSTTTGSGRTVSHDEQNGIAMELGRYCDKAIERIKGAINTGLWGTAVFYSARNELDAKVIGSYLKGEMARPSDDIQLSRNFEIKTADSSAVNLPIFRDGRMNDLLTPVSSTELGMLCMPPSEAVPDFEIREERLYPMISSGDCGIAIGQVAVGQRPVPTMKFALSESDLARHTFVCGITGSGKTTTVKGILAKCGKPFMVIESAKKEYRNIRLPAGRKVSVYTIGKPEINCPQLNPFYVQRGISLQTHIDYLKDLFSASFSFYGPMTYILEKCLQNIYIRKGWNIALGFHPYLVNTENAARVFDSEFMRERYSLKGHKYLFPTMQDLKDEVKRYVTEEMEYEGEVAGNIRSAMLARLESLCGGSKGFMFNTDSCLDMGSLMKENAVFELEGLADDADKAFCVGLFLIFVNEYRQVAKEEAGMRDTGLQHLLVIEEAHRLLKNVDTERSSEYLGNPKGKAVEHFTNMIAEMRSYGQGVIIAEQIPGKLAPDVIKNTSNKIIQRIVSSDDQRLVANTVGIREDDAIELGGLRTGMALCHKEGMRLPVLVKIDPVTDDFVPDDLLFLTRNGRGFENINYSIFRTVLAKDSEHLALRLLNTLMTSPDQLVMDCVMRARKLLVQAISRKNVSLAVCRNKEALAGRVIAEQIGLLLAWGAYGVKGILLDETLDCIGHMMQGDAGSISHLRETLRMAWGEDLRTHCIFVVSELIRHEYDKGVDLRKSISNYFMRADYTVLNEIESRVRKEAPGCL